jgi:putative phosphoribosyl transferase
MKFADRGEAGRWLADKLLHLKDQQPVVLALPRGGVAVGFEIAQALDTSLDIVLVRKIGVPWQPEFALGAVTDGASHETFIDRDLAASLDVPDSYIDEESARQLKEIERRRKLYCEGRPALEVAGHTAIVVDDGIATGATMRVALQAVRRRGPARLVLAVPVAPPDTLAALLDAADEAVCLETPIGLGAIGFYYHDFHQMSDAEVTDLLARAPHPAEQDRAS